MKIKAASWFAAAVLGAGAAPAQVPDQVTEHLVAAKAAGGTLFDGVLSTLCVAPNAGRTMSTQPPGQPRAVPSRQSWYAAPYRVFDNLYWVGTRVHSAWALKTSEGIILIDTLFSYAVEPEIVDGLKKLGFDPASIKYVIISHAHGDHDEGARLLQERYRAHIVMGAADWDLIERQTAMPGGQPKRDMIASDGQKITLGDGSVTIVQTPGHTPGTLSLLFQVKDRGRPLTVAYSGGTAFNFPHDAPHYEIYIQSQRKMAVAAQAAGATVLMSNHSQFDDAYDRVRLAQGRRSPGEPHPYEVGAEGVARYFTMTQECAQAAEAELAPH